MDIAVQLKALAEKVELLKDKIETEEATKHAFVLPFLNILGYDTFNPMEVMPEFTADVGIKKGEKVDYAIFQDGQPIIIIECKHWKSALSLENSGQLLRYFHVTQTKFSLLTNGIVYRFYTDLDNDNKMDDKPFLEFDITKLKDNTIREIEKFHKSNFDLNSILDNASTLKFTNEIKAIIESDYEEPSEEFVKYFASKVHDGRLTANVLAEFEPLVKKAFSQFISEKISDRLTSAINKEEKIQQEEVQELETQPEVDEDGIITTEEELEGYNIVLAIVRRKVEKSRIIYRDTKSYFGILLDDNNRKPICRLHLNGGVKYISWFDKDRKEIKEKINSVDDIFNYETQLLEIIDVYNS